jgi:hypothetical protein
VLGHDGEYSFILLAEGKAFVAAHLVELPKIVFDITKRCHRNAMGSQKSFEVELNRMLIVEQDR